MTALEWDMRFLALADHIATWSKDPSTRCGAVVIDPSNRIVSVGYNGFARGVEDTPVRLADREVKYRLTIHAERNALLFAHRNLAGCGLYASPLPTCADCAAMIIQSGIRRVVTRYSDNPRWIEAARLAAIQYREAGVAWAVYGAPSQTFSIPGHIAYPIEVQA